MPEVLTQPNCRRFELLLHQPEVALMPTSPRTRGQGETGQEIAATVNDLHRKPPYSNVTRRSRSNLIHRRGSRLQLALELVE